MGHDDEIVLAHVRISTLEMIIEAIQYVDMINNKDIENIIPPTPPRDSEPPVGSPILLSPSSLVGSSSPNDIHQEDTNNCTPPKPQAAIKKLFQIVFTSITGSTIYNHGKY
ncbi:hypothetical protein Tco_1503722 [Tanacetum coccineum]